MKLIGVELVKQDDQSDQWIVTYRYQAGSEREAMVHAGKTVNNDEFMSEYKPVFPNFDVVEYFYGKDIDDDPKVDDDPAVVKQRKDSYQNEQKRYPASGWVTETEFVSTFGRARIYKDENGDMFTRNADGSFSQFNDMMVYSTEASS